MTDQDQLFKITFPDLFIIRSIKKKRRKKKPKK